MKRKLISLAVLSLSLFVLFSASALAEVAPVTLGDVPDAQAGLSDRDETVFVNLSSDGAVQSVQVVEHFSVLTPGYYVLPPAYAQVTNLTDTTPTAQKDGALVLPFEVSRENFFLQGSLNDAQLPFLFDIRYTLDGQTVGADTLAGASGKLAIEIHVSGNPQAEAYWKEKSMMQLQVPLDVERFALMSATGASEVLAGKTRTLAYTVLPGDEATFVIEGTASNFEMEAISATLVEFQMDRMLGLGDLTTRFDELDEGITALSDASDQLLSGARALSDGGAELARGVTPLTSGWKQYTDGVNQLVGGLGTLTQNLPELQSGMKQTKQGLGQLSQGARALSEALSAFDNPTENSAVADAMLALSDSIQKNTSLSVSERLALLAQLNTVAGALQAQGEEIQGSFAQLKEGVKGLSDGLGQLDGSFSLLSGGVDALASGAGQMQQKAAALPSASKSLMDGLSKFALGTENLVSGLNSWVDGYDSMNDGQNALFSGLRQMQSQLSFLGGSHDQTAVSFVTGRADVRSVSFVIRASAIKLPEEPTRAAPEPEKTKGIWERFLDLFR